MPLFRTFQAWKSQHFNSRTGRNTLQSEPYLGWAMNQQTKAQTKYYCLSKNLPGTGASVCFTSSILANNIANLHIQRTAYNAFMHMLCLRRLSNASVRKKQERHTDKYMQWSTNWWMQVKTAHNMATDDFNNKFQSDLRRAALLPLTNLR